MRYVLVAVVGACSFRSGSVPVDTAAGSQDAAGEPDSMHTPPGDGTLDGTVPSSLVRSLDITDAEVAGGPHTDFPLLVSLSASWLKSTAHAGDVARDDGFDIYFSADQLGVTRLAHEVEVYDPATGDLVAWVKVPSLTAASVLFIHYGDTTVTTSQQNPTAVWSAGYALVDHLGSDSDATTNNTIAGSGATAASGKIGSARSFDGVSSSVSAGSNVAIDDIWAAGGSAEAWLYANSYGGGSRGRLFDKGDTSGWSFFVCDDQYTSKSISFVQGGSSYGQWHGASNAVSTGAWHHVAVDYDKSSTANNPTVYVDGVAITMTETFSPSGIVSDQAATLVIGNNPSLTRTFDGILDEVRLSSVTRASDWILTEYHNQSDPAAFYTVSAPL